MTGADVAVRLALGETQIVSDTRQFLLDNGVSLDAFNQVNITSSKYIYKIRYTFYKYYVVKMLMLC